MKKTLLVLLLLVMALLPQTLQAQVEAPFKTTTIVNGEFAKGTVWYTMQIGASQHIISDNGTADKISLQTSKTDLEIGRASCRERV